MVELTQIKGSNGTGARSTFDIDPPCDCGFRRVYRMPMEERYVFFCGSCWQIYPLFIRRKSSIGKV